jgi:hypothetical protein
MDSLCKIERKHLLLLNCTPSILSSLLCIFTLTLSTILQSSFESQTASDANSKKLDLLFCLNEKRESRTRGCKFREEAVKNRKSEEMDQKITVRKKREKRNLRVKRNGVSFFHRKKRSRR